jgi:hypothetical protein
MALIEIAMRQGAGVEQLERLMALQERFEANEARKAYFEAIDRFKANPPDIQKNKHVKFGNTEYDHATLDHVTNEVTKALSVVGISHRGKSGSRTERSKSPASSPINSGTAKEPRSRVRPIRRAARTQSRPSAPQSPTYSGIPCWQLPGLPSKARTRMGTT